MFDVPIFRADSVRNFSNWIRKKMEKKEKVWIYMSKMIGSNQEIDDRLLR